MIPDHDPTGSSADDETTRPSAGSESLVSPAGDGAAAPAAAHEPAGDYAATETSSEPLVQRRDSHNMLPGRDRRGTGIERLFVRLIATAGIVAVGVAIAAIMTSSHSQGWIIGLVVSVVTVVLAAVLWSSRQL